MARIKQTGKRHSSIRTIIVPQQVTIDKITGRERPIRNNVPAVVYLPKDAGRRERLIENNARINRERNAESRRGKRMSRMR